MAVALVLAGAGLLVLAWQVEVEVDGVHRTCGSAFDSAVDRSGWEQWWARDLDESDASVRVSLPRTTSCPDAVNGRMVLSIVLLAGAAILIAWVRHRSVSAKPRRQQLGPPGAELRRLGRVVSIIGTVLASAGVAAVVVLVADADATLFLYTGRLVVGVIGLIVLVPTLALVVIGRALSIIGSHVDGLGPSGRDPIEKSGGRQ